MPAFKQFRTRFHLFNIQIFLKIGHKWRTKRMVFFSEAEEICVFLHFRMLDNIEIRINFLDVQSPDVLRKIFIEEFQEIVQIRKWFVVYKQLKGRFSCGNHRICTTRTKDLVLGFRNDPLQRFGDQPFHGFNSWLFLPPVQAIA